MNKYYIFDTDIGDDIDDAFALSLLLKLAKPDLIGVTTVFRNTARRAQLVQKLLQENGATDIPAYAGEEIPFKEPYHLFNKEVGLAHPEKENPCQWREEYDLFKVQNGAVDFIVESAKKHGERLVILAVGPLTNVARAIEKAPDVMKNIGAIYSMGGWFSNFVPEWNILCDPEAADIVYRSGIEVYAVGLDVTLQCGLESDLLDKFRSSNLPTNKLLTTWLDRWFEFFNFEKSVMHDPLAVASAFSNVCAFEKRRVAVDLENNRGAIIVGAEKGVEINVATTVNRNLFYEMVESTLKK